MKNGYRAIPFLCSGTVKWPLFCDHQMATVFQLLNGHRFPTVKWPLFYNWLRKKKEESCLCSGGTRTWTPGINLHISHIARNFITDSEPNQNFAFERLSGLCIEQMRKYVCPRPFHSFHSIKSHIKGILDIEGGSNRFSASDCMK